MLRFFAALLVVQAASVGLVLLAGRPSGGWTAWAPTVAALGVIGLIAAFWFSTMAADLRRGERERMQKDFAKQREKLRVDAERAKNRLLKQSGKDLATETRKAESRANRKVATAVTVAAGVGVLMVMTSFMTLGLALLTGAGGALGGFLTGRRSMLNSIEGDGKPRLGSSLLAKKLQLPHTKSKH